MKKFIDNWKLKHYKLNHNPNVEGILNKVYVIK